jgi:hypothetical protein
MRHGGNIGDAGLLYSLPTQAHEGKAVMSDKTMPITGGCLCGAVRYEATEAPTWVALCHCRDCRRAVAAPLVGWAAFRSDAFTILAGDPATYQSSPEVVRTFCGRCGTSLWGFDNRSPDQTFVLLGSFDDAEELPPEFHSWRSHRLSWLETSDSLPRYVQSKNDDIMEEQPGQS